MAHGQTRDEATEAGPSRRPNTGQNRQPSTRQSLVAALISPAALVRMPRRAWLYFALYVGLSGLVLGLVAWQLSARRGDIEALVLGYLFPESWHEVVIVLVDHFFGAQHRLVMVNALVTSSLMVVTLVLFPVKELLSAAFERHGDLLEGEPMREHPLWQQAWQEIKLFVFFVVVQGAIFWLGYVDHPMTRGAAVALGLVFLWFSFAIDFIAPIFQRHLGYYSQIIKTLFRHGPSSLLFGAIFCAPTLLVAKLWDMNPSWSWTRAVFSLFGVNVLCIACAAACGTWLGARLYRGFAHSRRSGSFTRVLAWLLVLGALGLEGYVFGSVGLSAHHKSQILKCEYSVDVGSFEVDVGRAGLVALLQDRLEVSVHGQIRIHNPTDIDVRLEDNEVVIEHQGSQVASSRLAPMIAPAGETVTQTLRFTVQATPSQLAHGRDLLDGDDWRMTLYVQVAPYVRLPIRIL